MPEGEHLLCPYRAQIPALESLDQPMDQQAYNLSQVWVSGFSGYESRRRRAWLAGPDA